MGKETNRLSVACKFAGKNGGNVRRSVQNSPVLRCGTTIVGRGPGLDPGYSDGMNFRAGTNVPSSVGGQGSDMK
jgi:hypothetical protein